MTVDPNLACACHERHPIIGVILLALLLVVLGIGAWITVAERRRGGF